MIDQEKTKDVILPEYASNNTNKKFQGWHLDAIKEYNHHFENVQTARATETRKDVENEYQQSKFMYGEENLLLLVTHHHL